MPLRRKNTGRLKPRKNVIIKLLTNTLLLPTNSPGRLFKSSAEFRWKVLPEQHGCCICLANEASEKLVRVHPQRSVIEQERGDWAGILVTTNVLIKQCVSGPTWPARTTPGCVSTLRDRISATETLFHFTQEETWSEGRHLKRGFFSVKETRTLACVIVQRCRVT